MRKILGLSWQDQDGVIRISVTMDGTSKSQWARRLRAKGIERDKRVCSAFRSKAFTCSGTEVVNIEILRGHSYRELDASASDSKDDQIVELVCEDARLRGLIELDTDVACLLRYCLSDEDLEKMGLFWIAVMHKPIKVFDGTSIHLSVQRFYPGQTLAAAIVGNFAKSGSGVCYGFAFRAP